MQPSAAKFAHVEALICEIAAVSSAAPARSSTTPQPSEQALESCATMQSASEVQLKSISACDTAWLSALFASSTRWGQLSTVFAAPDVEQAVDVRAEEISKAYASRLPREIRLIRSSVVV